MIILDVVLGIKGFYRKSFGGFNSKDFFIILEIRSYDLDEGYIYFMWSVVF